MNSMRPGAGGKEPGLKSRLQSLSRAFAVNRRGQRWSPGAVNCQGEGAGKERPGFGAGAIDLGQLLSIV